MTNRTLVVSIDALITADIPVLKQLPNLGRVMEHASWITDIECIYPTLTYPCHATIATGCWPDRHGICNNEKFQPPGRRMTRHRGLPGPTALRWRRFLRPISTCSAG